MSNPTFRYSHLITMAFFGASVSAGLQAEVKSLSSSELTETYIQDSTIIVSPKKRASSRKSNLSNITVTPVDLAKENTQAISEAEDAIDYATEIASTAEALENADLLVSLALERQRQETLDTLIPEFVDPRLPEPDFPDDPRFIIPEGDFEDFLEQDGYGISRQDDVFTLSIGNIPGIDPINLPYGGKEGPVEVIPRESGGFDLKIQIPQD